MSLYLGNQKVTPTIYYKDNKKLTQVVDGSISELTAEDLKGITSIRGSAFSNCRGLTSITIPDSVTSIGASAFYNCSGLIGVTIGNSVTSIGDGAFYNCSGLASVTIGNSVTTIYNAAFNNCDKLKNIYITDLAAWCKISGLYQLMHYGSGNKNLYLNGELITHLTIPYDVKSIVNYAFGGCRSLTSVTIPDSVTSIRDGAFQDCSGLTSVTYLGTIDQWVEISFEGDSSNPLYNAHNLYINDELVTEVNLTTATKISGYAFYRCNNLTSVTIPDSVTFIGNYAFSGCSGLTSVTIPDSVTIIGDQAFSSCTGLTSVTIPDSVTSIRSWVFFGCSSLTSVIIPNSVTSIGSMAFFNCSGLTSVTIGNKVTSIDYQAFEGCSSLTSIIMLPTNPPTLNSYAIPSNVITITVPVGTGATYKAATNWSRYADKIQEAAA